ncbi:clumping factor A [Hyalella azteca]|uniref:Clumping factor A n=1 Tax=Hyalella azteca TaxID=294128 RepID=A0A8B7PL45_HYAAZ|nr:clumping factor A [Hyalella azteca]
MADIASQTATEAVSQGVLTESSFNIDKSESSKGGTLAGASSGGDGSVVLAVPSMPAYPSPITENKTRSGEAIGIVNSSLEDISCGTKKKKIRIVKGANNVQRNSESDSRAIKAGGELHKQVSVAAGKLEVGCAKLNLATKMERVNPDICTYGRSSSPYLSSENDWEASDHSDTDADHSDSSDDDNPTSQVDRMIERGARLIMDGENSNLSSETDDTDDSDDDENFESDSDSDITDVSPLVSNCSSPFSFSPVLTRKTLPSATSAKPAFMRHYSHRGHEGDVEDEIEEESHKQHQYAKQEFSNDDFYGSACDPSVDSDMSLVVQALLKIGLESRSNGADYEKNKNLQELNNHNLPPLDSASKINAIQVNPHHRHLRKSSIPRRKNMSFTNEEVRIINRDNSIILEKLLAVSNRSEKSPYSHAGVKHSISKPSNSSINRRKQEDGIKKDNLALLRRLQDVKPSRSITCSASSSHPSRHHHHHRSSGHHHHPRQHHNSLSSPARSCSATARQTAFPSDHHHSPKETAL